MERGKAKGRISVRRMQMKMLEAGNATMGIWLGKQLLGQTDEVNHNVNAYSALVLNLPEDLYVRWEHQEMTAIASHWTFHPTSFFHRPMGENAVSPTAGSS